MRLAAVPDRPRRAVAFIGVSDEGGRGDDLMSPAIQSAAIRDHCTRRGHELVATIERIDVSGSGRHGRDYAEAVDMIEAGHADIIVVWKWSRLARNRYAWAIAVDRIEAAGGAIESATEDIDTTTSAGRLARGMLAEFAAFEAERIGEGWRAAHGQRFAAGLSPAGRPPFGWRKAGRGIEPDPATAPAVVELYARYAAGHGFNQLAAWLNTTGHTTARGQRWHPNSVRAVLDNPTHAGLITYAGQTAPGAHQGIISEADWQHYRAQRRDSRRTGRRDRSPYLLSGLLVCGADGCGYRMTGQPPARYVCAHSAATGLHRHNSAYCKRVDDVVFAWLAGQADAINTAANRAPVDETPAADTVTLESRVTALDRKLARLTALLVDGTVPEAAYRLARDEIMAGRAELVAALQANTDRRVIAAHAPGVIDLVDRWAELPVTGKRAMLRALIDRVVLVCGPGFRVDVVELVEHRP